MAIDLKDVEVTTYTAGNTISMRLTHWPTGWTVYEAGRNLSRTKLRERLMAKLETHVTAPSRPAAG